MPINIHSAGLLYERLIMKAFNCCPGENGAKAGYFMNLYKAEQEESHELIKGSYREQYEDIRSNLLNAVKEIQKKGLNTSEFAEIEKRINTCSTANCLAKQVKYALAILAGRD